MNINTNANLTFGGIVSTSLLLKAGSGVIKFEDAKLLNKEAGVKYSGHISFYKRALAIAQKASEADEKLAEIFEKLKLTPQSKLEEQIQIYTDKLGEKIDIKI